MIAKEDKVWLYAAARVQAVIDMKRRSRNDEEPEIVKLTMIFTRKDAIARLGKDGPRALRETTPRLKIHEVSLYVVDCVFEVKAVRKWAARKHWRWRLANPLMSHEELAATYFESQVIEVIKELQQAKHKVRQCRRDKLT